jgi:hypothetical protein
MSMAVIVFISIVIYYFVHGKNAASVNRKSYDNNLSGNFKEQKNG